MTEMRKRILWADDQSAGFGFLQRVLESFGHVSKVGSVVEAKQAIDEEKFDVAIIDILMPHGAGRIANDPYLGTQLITACTERNLPVLVLSFVKEDEYDGDRALPVHAYFSKLDVGTRMDEFIELIAKAMGAEPSVYV